MASDGEPVQIPAVSLVHGSQAPKVKNQSGKILPQSGSAAKAAAPAKASTPIPTPDVQVQVASLNKFLNDSGYAAQFRIDPTSRNKIIQEINPANGEVIAEYSATEFAALARSLGVSGAIIDSHA